MLIGLILSLASCDVMKRVGEEEKLLVDNTVIVDGDKTNTEEINSLIYQKPNGNLLGVPIRLHIYNLARPNIDSILNAKYYNPDNPKDGLKKLLSIKQYEAFVNSKRTFNTWLKEFGEAPVILNQNKIDRTTDQLRKYYFSQGWFDAETSFEIEEKKERRASVIYKVERNKPYFLDSINKRIASPLIDSIYRNRLQKGSLIKKGQQYNEDDYTAERDRLTVELRNSGLYHFGQDYISYDLDTINNNHKIVTDLIIKNRAIRTLDSTLRIPFKIYKIKEVNIFTDDTYKNSNATISDSVVYNDYNLYSYEKFKYRPKALTDAIFITKGDVFKDIARTRTYRYLSELRAFKYPNIDYVVSDADTTLTANIYLVPRKKFELNASFEVSQSNIQRVGLGFNSGLTIRNLFKGAETLQISALGSIGSSRDANNNTDQFFDITELGGNIRLTIPRIFLPFNTEKIIPKFMSPSTRFTLGASSQTNIGLDKQTLTGTFNFNWYPSETVTNNFDLFNIQFVKNLNIDNYFGVYQNSFERLNEVARNIDYISNDNTLQIPTGANNFINEVLTGNTSLTPDDPRYTDVNNINERKERLTEDNLIISSSFNYIKDKRENLFDNDFSIFRFRTEFAGNLLASLSGALKLDKNENDRYEVVGVAFSQFIKNEVDYVKHWDLGKQSVFAIRTYAGLAVPYGNSNSIPFAKSFFAGGPNDIRAWTAYNLGPGKSDNTNEFNEANFKITLSAEQRFNIFGRFNGAFFVDAGNIWNVFDNVEDEAATFSGFNSLKDIAIGSGFGLRYDFSFFVLRFDIGFKTYDPARQLGNRWFKDYNFNNAVYNIGINYPF